MHPRDIEETSYSPFGEAATGDSDRAREARTLASTCRRFGLPAVADKLNCIEETGRQLVRDLVELRAAVEGL